MSKRNVWAEEDISYPVNRVEIQGVKSLWVFFLRKQDAFDETAASKAYRQMCDNYLGEPLDVDKVTRKVTKRAKPKMTLPSMGAKVVQPDEDLFFVVANICVMQPWDTQEDDCYEPEEIIGIAAKDKTVWDQLQAKADEINGAPLGNASAEPGEEKSAPASNS